jgi:hypothetical protein
MKKKANESANTKEDINVIRSFREMISDRRPLFNSFLDSGVLNEHYDNLMQAAVYHGNLDALKALVEHGAKIDAYPMQLPPGSNFSEKDECPETYLPAPFIIQAARKGYMYVPISTIPK